MFLAKESRNTWILPQTTAVSCHKVPKEADRREYWQGKNRDKRLYYSQATASETQLVGLTLLRFTLKTQGALGPDWNLRSYLSLTSQIQEETEKC